VAAYTYGMLTVLQSERIRAQIYIPDDAGSDSDIASIYVRSIWDNATNKSWARLSKNMPSFYKNYADLSSLANALGANTTRYLECSHHNGGSDINVFKQYVVSEMTSSIQPTIIRVDSNTFSVAIGIKFNDSYGGFVLMGYSGIYALCLSNGTWTTKQLDQ